MIYCELDVKILNFTTIYGYLFYTLLKNPCCYEILLYLYMVFSVALYFDESRATLSTRCSEAVSGNEKVQKCLWSPRYSSETSRTVRRPRVFTFQLVKF